MFTHMGLLFKHMVLHLGLPLGCEDSESEEVSSVNLVLVLVGIELFGRGEFFTLFVSNFPFRWSEQDLIEFQIFFGSHMFFKNLDFIGMLGPIDFRVWTLSILLHHFD